MLAQVLQFIEHGWPHITDSSFSPYSSHKAKLSVYDGCILWGSRVVVPPQGQKAVLQELHSAHPGMTKMKSLARMYVWWPGLDKDIEESVRLCNECQLNHLQLHHSTRGVGHQDPGQESTWTTLGRLKVIIY